MAATPAEISHGFVLNGADLVWSMLQGERCSESGMITASKHLENRRGRMPEGYYAVNLGKTNGETPERRRVCQEALPTMHIPQRDSPEVQAMVGCSVGVVKIEHSLPCAKCEGDVWKNDAGVCNVISKVAWFSRPVPVKGNLGTFPIKDEAALAAVREQASQATLYDTQWAKTYRKRHPWPPKRKGAIDLSNPGERAEMFAFLQKAQATIKRKIEEAEGNSAL